VSEASWLSPAVLARLKGQAPATQDSIRLLANGAEHQPSASQESGQPDEVPAVGDNDPNNNPDPDDHRVEVPILEAPPQQTEVWWTTLIFGSDGARVSQQDAEMVLRWVAYRLGREISPEVVVEISQRGTLGVGELHEAVEEAFGSAGWSAFIQCWQEAAGIVQPVRPKPQSRCSAQNTDGKPDSTPAANQERNSDSDSPIDPGLLSTLSGMPDRLRNWMLRPPEADSLPPWRTETVGEREAREQAEADGAWAGI
jgi:hypothetical protein